MATKKKTKIIQAPSFSFKCDPDLKNAFVASCESVDVTASQELRAFMRKFVKRHGQTELF